MNAPIATETPCAGSLHRLVSLPVEQAYPLELSTGATTLFFGRLGSNTVWGFVPPEGKPGVAITDGRCGQAVVNLDNLRELVRLMEANQPSSGTAADGDA